MGRINLIEQGSRWAEFILKQKGDCHAKEGKGINAPLSASHRTAGA